LYKARLATTTKTGGKQHLAGVRGPTEGDDVTSFSVSSYENFSSKTKGWHGVCIDISIKNTALIKRGDEK